MIDKWLKAGVLKRACSAARRAERGVISPPLSNIYLHHVLDGWFETVARPRLKGRCQLVRYADDAVMAFEDHLSGKRMLAVLGKRLERFGLTLHPTKTRFVDFRFKRPQGRHLATTATTFDFLGFTHVWSKSLKGKDVVRQITAKDRYARALAAVVPTKSAPSVPRAARSSVTDDPGALRLLRHLRQRQEDQMVSPPGRADLEKTGRSSRTPQQAVVAALPRHARATPVAASLDRSFVRRPMSKARARRTGCG
jgi:hypothetical protein